MPSDLLELVKDVRSVAPDELDQHHKNLDVYGYTRVENLLGKKLVSGLSSEIAKHLDHYDPKLIGRLPDEWRDAGWFYNPHNRHKLFIDILTLDVVKAILIPRLNDTFHRYIPQDTANYNLGFYFARSSGSYLEIHGDSYIPAPGKSSYSMHVSYILNDQTVDNGCTFVVPGSHRIDDFSDRKLHKREPIESPAGDLLIYESRLWHGAFENRTKEPRWVLTAIFRRYWLKPTMDPTKSLPQKIYEQLTDEQKSILGFCSIAPGDEFDGRTIKDGFDSLRPLVKDYHA